MPVALTEAPVRQGRVVGQWLPRGYCMMAVTYPVVPLALEPGAKDSVCLVVFGPTGGFHRVYSSSHILCYQIILKLCLEVVDIAIILICCSVVRDPSRAAEVELNYDNCWLS